MSKKEVMEIVSAALGGRENFLAVRGLEESSCNTGDIDILVAPGFASEACLCVSEYAKNLGWYLIGYKDLGYVCSVVLHRPGRVNADYAVKLDFINGLSWLGIEGDLPTIDLFSEKWRQVWKRHDDKRICGLVSFMQKMLASGFVSESDWARIELSGAEPNYILETFSTICLPITEEEIKNRSIRVLKKWIFRYKSSGLTGISGFFRWAFSILIYAAKYKPGFNFQSGFLVSISGMDGAGKSTLVDRLLRAFYRSGGLKPKIIHLLPTWFPMPHQLFSRELTKINYQRPYSEKPVKSKINGFLRLLYYFFGFYISKVFIQVKCSRGHIFIQDRSFFDFSSDLSRAKIPAIKIPGLLKRVIHPRGLYVYLDASAHSVVNRKNELTAEKASALGAEYVRNAPNFNALIINADTSAEDVYEVFLLSLHNFLIAKFKRSFCN